MVGLLDENPVSEPPVLGAYRLCGTYQGSVPAGEWGEITCSPNANGRYVIIQIPGANEILMMCEVEVFGNGKWSTYCTTMFTFCYHDKMHLLSLKLCVYACCFQLYLLSHVSYSGYIRSPMSFLSVCLSASHANALETKRPGSSQGAPRAHTLLS